MGEISLRFVRDQLDWLGLLRLQGPLSRQDQETYEALCRKERQLMLEADWASL